MTPPKGATAHPSPRHDAAPSSSSSSSWSYLSAAAIGLLSSSCCVIQLVLNVFSIGCAGFSILTPLRPFFIAISTGLILYTVYRYRWSARTAITLVLTLFLTATPEMVALHNQSALGAWSWNSFSSATWLQPLHQLYYNSHLRTPVSVPNPPVWSLSKQQQQQQQQQQTQQCQDATDPQTLREHEPEIASQKKTFQTDKPLIRYELSVDGMACEACANRLRQHFAHREGIERVSVFFADKKLVLWTRSGVGAMMLTEERIRTMVREVDDKYSVRLLDMYSS
ncbi:hypothetical protein EC968_002555 [Mortierella alpina]|nr:hypothetical protein EC968_002555 [Mortierella alpina]